MDTVKMEKDLNAAHDILRLASAEIEHILDTDDTKLLDAVQSAISLTSALILNQLEQVVCENVKESA